MADFNTHGGYFAPADYTRINAGGTHEENPNGGVQLGVDPQGVPNVLEEGEPVYKDFVFSDNIKAKKKYLEEFNVPTKYDGWLYSEIVDDLFSEAEERPNDPISKNGLDAMLSRVAQAQEAQKAAEEEAALEEELANMSPEERVALEQMLMQEAAQQEGQSGTPVEPVPEGVPTEAYGAVPEEQVPMEAMAAQPVMAMGGPMNSFWPGGLKKTQKMLDSATAKFLEQSNGSGIGLKVDPITGAKYEEPLVQESPGMDVALTVLQPGGLFTKLMAPSAYKGIVNTVGKAVNGEPVDTEELLAQTTPVSKAENVIAKLFSGSKKVPKSDVIVKNLAKEAKHEANRAKNIANTEAVIAENYGTVEELENEIKHITDRTNGYRGTLSRQTNYGARLKEQLGTADEKLRDAYKKASAPNASEADKATFEEMKKQYDKVADKIDVNNENLKGYRKNIKQSSDKISDLETKKDYIGTSPDKMHFGVTPGSTEWKVSNFISNPFYLWKNRTPLPEGATTWQKIGRTAGNIGQSALATGVDLALAGLAVKNVSGKVSDAIDNYQTNKADWVEPKKNSKKYGGPVNTFVKGGDKADGNENNYNSYYFNSSGPFGPYRILDNLLVTDPSKYGDNMLKMVGRNYFNNNSSFGYGNGIAYWPRGNNNTFVGYNDTYDINGEPNRFNVAYTDVVPMYSGEQNARPSSGGTRYYGQTASAPKVGPLLSDEDLDKIINAPTDIPGITSPLKAGAISYSPELLDKINLASQIAMRGKDDISIPPLTTSSNGRGNRHSTILPTQSRHMDPYNSMRLSGIFANGLLAANTLLQDPDHYDDTPIRPVLPTGRIQLQDQRYMPYDMNMMFNQMQAQNTATARALQNSGIGPSTGAALAAADYTGALNLGNALNQIWQANNQERNRVIAANNQNAATKANFYRSLDSERAQILNNMAWQNRQNALRIALLNDQAEQQKYNAFSQNFSNFQKGLSDYAREMMDRKLLRENDALYYSVNDDNTINYKKLVDYLKNNKTLLKKIKDDVNV